MEIALGPIKNRPSSMVDIRELFQDLEWLAIVNFSRFFKACCL
jgi:hypothetical protein